MKNIKNILDSNLSQKHLSILIRLKKQILLPALRSGRLGKLLYVDIDFFMKEERLKSLTILKMFEKGLIFTLLKCRNTGYYKRKSRKRMKLNAEGKLVRKGGRLWATVKILNYYRLYKNIKKKGIRINSKKPNDYPSILLTNEYYYMLDGAHRAGVARFLGYKKIPAIVITPKDILKLGELQEISSSF